MTRTFSPATAPVDAAALLGAATEHDGVAPLSEQFLAGLDDPSLGHTHTVARDGEQLVGLAAQAPDGGVELVVAPGHRRQGIGRELISLIDVSLNPSFWAHGNLPGAEATAAALGMRVTRELLVMGIGADALDLGREPQVPEGFEALNYPDAVARFGRREVEQAWLDVNNDAFSWHPEQGGWDVERLHRGMAAEWFDPAGVWFLVDTRAEARAESSAGAGAPVISGFHWTKRHPDGTGEVYVVGLASSYRGEGMGGPLMDIGLAHLQEQGSQQVILYVEADNKPAVTRYSEIGFTIRERHVVYEFSGS